MKVVPLVNVSLAVSIATMLQYLPSSIAMEDEVDETKEIDYSWLSCEEFLDHSARINKAVGLKDPRRIAGYSRLACKRAFEAAKYAKIVDHVVNLRTFVKEGGDFSNKDAVVPDEAEHSTATSTYLIKFVF